MVTIVGEIQGIKITETSVIRVLMFRGGHPIWHEGKEYHLTGVMFMGRQYLRLHRDGKLIGIIPFPKIAPPLKPYFAP